MNISQDLMCTIIFLIWSSSSITISYVYWCILVQSYRRYVHYKPNGKLSYKEHLAKYYSSHSIVDHAWSYDMDGWTGFLIFLLIVLSVTFVITIAIVNGDCGMCGK